MNQNIFSFEQGNASLRNLLGGKGANLGEMTQMGLPVPHGFTITTEVCNEFLKNNNTLSSEVYEDVKKAVANLEKQSGKKFGWEENPLLVSVRSGSAVSMPGMMDTILNLGLNDKTVESLSGLTENPRFAYDCYRRLLQMFGEVVFGIPKDFFEEQLEKIKTLKNVKNDADLSAEDLKNLTLIFKDIYTKHGTKPFPQDPEEQLLQAVDAVFISWDNPRAKIYRDANSISHDLGTAVSVQMMVFGNYGDTSGTGVIFTRNPAHGENKLFGEFLLNAQGEDVVAGIRTPEEISTLKVRVPSAYAQLLHVREILEKRFKDMQDIEFTIEEGQLYLLQTRSGKRTAQAAFKIACDMVEEGLITPQEALLSLHAESMNQLLHPVFSQEVLESKESIGQGLPASPGVASGKVYFSSEKAKEMTAAGENVILFRRETSPDDIEGTITSQAVVTSSGGMTSHAAVVARGLGKCCVAGVDGLLIDEKAERATLHSVEILQGDVVSVDGNTGKLYLGEIEMSEPSLNENFHQVMKWAKEYRKLMVYANGDTKEDMEVALGFGAQGVGLARTEHMFFEKSKLEEMRILILSHQKEEKEKALEKLLQLQIQDFTDLYSVMGQLPITIRLLDPPLHEFLPSKEEDILALSQKMNISQQALQERIGELQEVNPMLGHRGCRMGITSPEIYEMQVEAVLRSALRFLEKGMVITPEIMIPLIGTIGEARIVRESLEAAIADIFKETGKTVPYHIGTMIETPRACLVAGEIAKEMDFFSFGTNDLTQMTYGFSRDDVGKFMHTYLEKGILPNDPFQVLDVEGVGQLIEMTVENGRKEKKDLPIGVCGEVGGNPKSIEFFHALGISYVSCSPYRLPIAMLAAAQAALRDLA